MHKEKYRLYLADLQEGDILFTRGSSLLARAIQKIDKCTFNHCGIVCKDHEGRPFVLESLEYGATYTPLQERVYANENFTVYRTGFSEGIIKRAFESLEEKIRKGKAGAAYDVWLLPKIALSRMTTRIPFAKTWFQQDNNSSKDICSELVRRYTDLLGMEHYGRENMKKMTGKEWITPKDFLYYNEGQLTRIL